MKGAAAAAIRSHFRIGKVSQALQLESPTPQAQFVGSLPRWTTLGSVESEYHWKNRLSTRTAAATMPMISERSSFDASSGARSADTLSIGRPYPNSPYRVAVGMQRWGL